MADDFKIAKDFGVAICRDQHGVVHIKAPSLSKAYWGLGYCHALDRSLQLLIMRILGRGLASQYLEPSETMLGIDIFFRRMGWAAQASAIVASFSSREIEMLSAYCQGINRYLEIRVPWEFKLTGYRPTPWTMEDVIVLSRMVGYLSLAQSQDQMERVLVEMVQAGVERAKLEELFPGVLAEMDEQLLRQVQLGQRVIPSEIIGQFAPPLTGSNNWVVSGARSASGKPLLANDPHLETNRLPNIWYEAVLELTDRYMMGATMPGLPGVLLGRTRDISWGATYSFADAIDSWVEHCKDGCYRREGDWLPFRQRREIIERKNKSPHEVVFYENEHGMLDGDPTVEGYYLTTGWSAQQGDCPSLRNMLDIWQAQTAAEGMELLGQLETSWNWVVADSKGNIGYQMSGRLPVRRQGVSGMVPLPGWDKANDWLRLADWRELPRVENPESGYFITANNDMNQWGQIPVGNHFLGPYRANRIEQLIGDSNRLTPEQLQEMQSDVYSLQAEGFMAILRPLLPTGKQGEILRQWDCRYQSQSIGAFCFEKIYRELLREVFGKQGPGLPAIDHLLERTDALIFLHYNCDRILLAEQSAWFGDHSRDELYRRAIDRALETPARTWGQANRFRLKHLLLGDKLPGFFGFNRGPFPMRGGRATVCQGQIQQAGDRRVYNAPSFRMVADMAQDGMHTNLAGGPSDRRFSKWYCSDLDNWQNGKYKLLQLE